MLVPRLAVFGIVVSTGIFTTLPGIVSAGTVWPLAVATVLLLVALTSGRLVLGSRLPRQATWCLVAVVVGLSTLPLGFVNPWLAAPGVALFVIGLVQFNWLTLRWLQPAARGEVRLVAVGVLAAFIGYSALDRPGAALRLTVLAGLLVVVVAMGSAIRKLDEETWTRRGSV